MERKTLERERESILCMEEVENNEKNGCTEWEEGEREIKKKKSGENKGYVCVCVCLCVCV